MMHRLKSIKVFNKKYFGLPLILFFVLTMTVVCASFSQTMFISGDAYVRVNADIRVNGVDIKENGVTNYANQTADSVYSKNISTMYISLPNLNSTITYNVYIKNNSNERYTIENITSNINNNKIKSNASDYIHQIIEPNSTTTLEITYQYDTETLPENTKATGIITYTFSKPKAAMVQYSSEYTACSNVQCSLDELYGLLDD